VAAKPSQTDMQQVAQKIPSEPLVTTNPFSTRFYTDHYRHLKLHYQYWHSRARSMLKRAPHPSQQGGKHKKVSYVEGKAHP